MNMIQQEIEQEKQLNRMDDRNGEINPYREPIVNNAEETELPMTQWSSGQFWVMFWIMYNIANLIPWIIH